jgi:hypothetical protein
MTDESPRRYGLDEDNPVRLLPEKAPQPANSPVPQTESPPKRELSQIEKMADEAHNLFTRRVFTTNYDIPDQIRFRKALDDKDYGAAAQILREIPRGTNIEEDAERAVTLIEGYRGLLNRVLIYAVERGEIASSLGAFSKMCDSFGLKTYESIEELVKERDKYHDINLTPEKIVDICGRLEKYMAVIGTRSPEDVKADFEYMKDLRKAAGGQEPEDLKKALETLERYKKFGTPEQLEAMFGEGSPDKARGNLRRI